MWCRHRQPIEKGKQLGRVWGSWPEELITCSFYGEEFKGPQLVILVVGGYIEPACPCPTPRLGMWLALPGETPCELL